MDEKYVAKNIFNLVGSIYNDSYERQDTLKFIESYISAVKKLKTFNETQKHLILFFNSHPHTECVSFNLKHYPFDDHYSVSSIHSEIQDILEDNEEVLSFFYLHNIRQIDKRFLNTLFQGALTSEETHVFDMVENFEKKQLQDALSKKDNNKNIVKV